ncbi:MAG: heme ABC exporter ATP-binding protein CcmA [Anaerolineae bacterium]
MGLSKSFGPRRALQGVNLRVAKGEFLTLVGPNGAGKTTLIQLLSTLTRPTAGTARVAGHDLRGADADLRRQIGLVSHQVLLYEELTAMENLRFFGRLYDLDRLEDAASDALERVGLTHRAHDPVRTLSRGMQQRLGIARAILHHPAILLLDEPFTGLDPSSAEMLRGTLMGLAEEGRTTLMATHNLALGLELCHRLAILVRGRIVVEADRESLDTEALLELYRRQVGEAV